MTERDDLTYNAGMIPPPDNTAGVMGDHLPSPQETPLSSPSSEGREEFPHDIDKALALLASVESKCDDNDGHSWATCRHCLAVDEIHEQRGLVGALRKWFTTLRASLTEAQAELTHMRAEHGRLKLDRDSWRRCADARESERLELVRAFLDFVVYVRGESPSLLTDECIDACRIVDLEARLKSDGAQ